MPPGSAMPSSLAAMLTPSPRMSLPSMRMSPRLIPIRNSYADPQGPLGCVPACTATAHSAASTTEGNSSNTPSPVVFTRRSHVLPRGHQ